jgi:orotidine-5'-phosphate decarboxylase
MMPARDRVIVALDVPDLAALEVLLDRLAGVPVFYKVGLELFVAEGARAVEAVARRGGKVFLDLKLHDIPETVARAVRSAAKLGVEFVTVHSTGGPEMLSRAVEAADGKTRIVAVTVLTHLTPPQLNRMGMPSDPGALVARLAGIAAQAGVPGLVCSPHEVTAARSAHQKAFTVVPGVRPAGAALGDQKRVATPGKTAAAGADYLVVGRPIRDAADPAAAFQAIVSEVEAACRP